MSEEDKHKQILGALEKVAQKMEYGVIVVELKVHRGQFTAGDVIEKKEKLG